MGVGVGIGVEVGGGGQLVSLVPVDCGVGALFLYINGILDFSALFLHQ